MTRNILTILAISWCFIPAAFGDLCIATLGSVDPGQAAMLSAKKQKAEQDAQKEFDWGKGNRVENAKNKDEAEGQITADAAARGAKIGGDYTAASAPVFAAGAAKAMAMMNIPAATILGQCAGMEAAQGGAQIQNSGKNKDVARTAAREDANRTDGFDTKVTELRE